MGDGYAEIGFHMSDVGQLAERVAERIGDPTRYVPRDYHSDCKVRRRLVAISGITAESGLFLAETLAAEICFLVPRIREAIETAADTV